MILLILFIFFIGCSSNEAILRRIDTLEKKIDQLHSAEYSGEIIFTDRSLNETEIWDGIIDGEELERFNLEQIRKIIEEQSDVQRLFCAQCKKEGLTSTIQRGMSMTTLMGTHEYWDEDGSYHYSDPNYTTTEWSCSQDHEWTTSE